MLKPLSKIKRLECEIQLRTSFQDFWARYSHQLVYKQKDLDKDSKLTLKAIGEHLEIMEFLAERLGK